MATKASETLSPWELREERFQQRKREAFGGDNGQRSGSSSSPPLTQTQTAETDSARERLASEAKTEGGLAADPSHARRGPHVDQLSSKSKEIAYVNRGPKRGLSTEIKEFMVESFAHFKSVNFIYDEILSRYGVKLDRRTIENFNPDSRRCVIGKRLKSLFISQRKAYIEECAKVAVSHQAHRLRLIGDIVAKATTAKDFSNALKGLELAAKEMGGLSQKVEHTGIVAHVHGSVEDARREVADRLRALMPVIDIPSGHVTETALEDMRHVTGDSDHAPSTDMPPLRTGALDNAALPSPAADIPDSDREASDTGAKASTDDHGQASGD